MAFRIINKILCLGKIVDLYFKGNRKSVELEPKIEQNNEILRTDSRYAFLDKDTIFCPAVQLEMYLEKNKQLTARLTALRPGTVLRSHLDGEKYEQSTGETTRLHPIRLTPITDSL